MKMTRRYDFSQGREAAERQALEDLEFYCGPAIMAKLERLFLLPNAPYMDLSTFGQARWSYTQVRFAMLLLGVQGLPVRAYARKAFHAWKARRERWSPEDIPNATAAYTSTED